MDVQSLLSQTVGRLWLIFNPDVSQIAWRDRFKISDFRIQIEGCLMQTGYMTKKRMQL